MLLGEVMCNLAHRGNAADEQLRLPLGLVAHVRLDDAVTNSPAVVEGRVFIGSSPTRPDLIPGATHCDYLDWRSSTSFFLVYTLVSL